jgi:isopenicillin N synthase-like dioxygenase
LLRILHYPPISGTYEEGAQRSAPHEDINFLTLLPTATAPGLQVQDVKGQWHEVACDPGSIVVNVGDMLQLCTEQYYVSTTHRVTNPAMNENTARYSMPFFLHGRDDVMLSASQSYAECLNQRLKEIGIY